MPRNRELMRVFRDVELVEQLGSGMSRILRAYGRDVFEISTNFIRVVFYFDKVEDDNVNDRVNDIENDKKRKAPSAKEEILLSLLADDPTITIGKMSDKIGVSERTISRYLDKLRTAGKVERQGADKNGRWIVKDPLKKNEE